MENISELNKRYLELTALRDTISFNEQTLQKLVETNEKSSPENKLSSFVENAIRINGLVDSELSEERTELLVIGQSCLVHMKALETYRKTLLALVAGHGEKMNKVSDSLISSQKVFQANCLTFSQKHGITIQSVDDIVVAYLKNIKCEKERLNQLISQVFDQAKKVIEKNDELSLEVGNKFNTTDVLPEKILLAKYSTGKSQYKLLSDLGVESDYINVGIDMKKQGNVLIETDYAQTLDEELDFFVLAYIFKFLESFPIGSANVHIFDRNPNKYNQRLCNIFKEGKYCERAKKTISLYNYSSLSELCDVTNVIIGDVFRKTSVKHPDLYEIHNSDKSDPFTLIVLRDGLIDQGGHVSASILDSINLLTKPGESGHLCGIRFLIIDDSASRKRSLGDDSVFLINSIRNNCSLHIQYAQNKFIYNKHKIDIIRIDDELNGFIQTRATEIANLVNGLEQKYISVSEISNTTAKDPNDSIFRIPIGKAGNTIIEIPLSCKDENGTVDGQCIGYMAIGQSGSGKSSFFHSVVINGCLQYSPADLQFWLLDFKYGGASSKYNRSQIPHVRIVSENNKIDDALCLFQMVSDEMEMRNKLIIKKSVDNIVEYNQLVEPEKRLPRIVILIDEVQEIFRDENAAELQKMISSISVRMRSVGMHFIMVAQNLSEGKSYMLREAFLPSATGRICFRVAENMPRESGFDESFIQRRNEITVLSTGEAYVSWGKDTIKKVKMAYASPEDMNNHLFAEIKDKYRDFSYLKPMVIGSKRRLAITDKTQNTNRIYADEINSIIPEQIRYQAIVGEDSYRMSPLKVFFSPYENSSLLLLGDDKEISSSLCTSIALSLIKQDVEIHLFNADRQKGQYDGEVKHHPFMYLCSKLKAENNKIAPHNLNEFDQVLKNMYEEYLRRVELVQACDADETPEFESIFLIANDLFAIQKFNNNDYIESALEEPINTNVDAFDFSVIDSALEQTITKDAYKERVQDIVSILVKEGYRYNIFLVLAIKGDPSIWRNMRPTDVNNVIMYNSTQYVNYVENQFYVREMLKNISPEIGNETIAVWINKNHVSKIRPFIYDMSSEEELHQVDLILE